MTELITYSEMNLKLLMDCFSPDCDEFGLTISLKKTVVMHQPAPVKTCDPTSIHVNSKGFEVVYTFDYLSIAQLRHRTLDEEVCARTAKEFDAYGKLRTILWPQSDITKKIGVYHAGDTEENEDIWIEGYKKS